MPTELFVSRRGSQTWAALREDGKTTEFRVESPQESTLVGRIVRARVTRILPGIQSAFLDLGSDRDGFLHVTDLWLPGEEAQAPFRTGPAAEATDPGTAATNVAAHGGRSTNPAPIQDRLKVGQDLIVQVARGPLGNKGARVTSYLTLPGRFLVLFPQLRLRSVSRRIVDVEERARLLGLLADLPGEDLGFVARTAAAEADAADLKSDAETLLASYRAVERDSASGGPPGVLHGDLELALRLLRDAPREGYARVVFDDPSMFDRATAYAAQAAPDLLSSIARHEGPRDLFESAGLDEEIERALRPKVWLKSGGYIVIEPTEALISIDVNTGKFLGRHHLEETVLATNLEAAVEIARQLRLRDLGGIIVIDFIDMTDDEHRKQVADRMTEALKRDRARTNVHEFSALGLLQLTRKRTRRAPEDHWTQRCTECRGVGRVKRPETVAEMARGELLRLAEGAPGASFVLSATRGVLDSLAPLPEPIEVRLKEACEMAAGEYEIRLIPAGASGGPPG